jgi:peptide/nickel transport system permease protein
MAFLLRRIAISLVLAWIVASIVFLAIHLVPGDPAEILLSAGGSAPDAATVADLRDRLGLNLPLLTQYANFLTGVLHGDLGTSIFTNLPVTHMIAQRIQPTLSLMVITLVISLTFAIPLGVVAAWKQGSWIDRLSMILSTLGFSVPVFVVGYVLAYTFALSLDWVPVQGYTPIDQGLWKWFQNLILPAIALGLIYMALIARITRATMLEVLSQDYVRTARAKGVDQKGILFIHALKNAAVPIVTIVGIGFASLIGGAVVTESVFAIPGLGRLTVDAILRRDYPVIQGVVLMFSFIYVLVNLGVDLLYTLFDPRIRY